MLAKKIDKAVFSMAVGICLLAAAPSSLAQTRESGPWWPSPHGPEDQAGASNYVTAEKTLRALQIPQTGQTYELGHPYEASMPFYSDRPYHMNVVPPPEPTSGEGGVALSEYFTGYIGQIGT